jgi:hypothetical protein
MRGWRWKGDVDEEGIYETRAESDLQIERGWLNAPIGNQRNVTVALFFFLSASHATIRPGS